ncbi:MAG: hypothetical protein R3C68_03740 [Myxococcota bacterium]
MLDVCVDTTTFDVDIELHAHEGELGDIDKYCGNVLNDFWRSRSPCKTLLML